MRNDYDKVLKVTMDIVNAAWLEKDLTLQTQTPKQEVERKNNMSKASPSHPVTPQEESK